MDQHELLRLLVERDGGALPSARKMGRKGLQPTLHRFAHRQTRELKRHNAERIAKHFGIDIDALFDKDVAGVEARRLGLEAGGQFSIADEPSAPAHTLREPPAPPLNFADRHEVSDSDWATLQAVKVVLDERELDSIRKRAEALMQRANRELAERLAKAKG